MIRPEDRAVAADVATMLSSFTYRWSTERELQEAIWDCLQPRWPMARREASLSPRDRPDFMVPVGDAVVAIEVKVKGARAAIWRQLGRYAEHPSVDAVVFASGKRTLLAACPAELHGKPVAVALLAASL